MYVCKYEFKIPKSPNLPNSSLKTSAVVLNPILSTFNVNKLSTFGAAFLSLKKRKKGGKKRKKTAKKGQKEKEKII